ncbi:MULTISPECIES: alpha-amylase [unclassified Sphingobium]|uniref:alpha-amylase n=1 Tax=unclassified Sphingobium TaxID=2611147 RepID=UPI0022241D5C|nr:MULTISPECIES: alpha-amylase [unclassified Sphingobium]MCW2413076.1 alpha-amylase [Sphingobium sp. B8D3D]MCW2414626.1 alpha-amylase [Sphingobium sp. B8D3A]
MPPRTLIQFFHWYTQDGGLHWDEVADKSASLAGIGITDVWLPPAGKGAAGGYSVGYDAYDLFDLGEFDQKGTVATKYGDRAALERACAALRDAGLRVIHDVVFNHKMGGDETEQVRVRRVNPDNRTEIEDEAFEARAYTRFTFPGRNGAYSKFIWDARCFSGVDHLDEPNENGVFKLVNDYGDGEWNAEVDEELGNFDYLMGSDIEFRNNAVYEELKYWGRWLAEQLPVDGFRLDAAKHIPAWFFRDWVGHMRESVADDLFVVAEYWHPDMTALQTYLDRVDHQLALFDVALHHRFHEASCAGDAFDMRTIFDGSLVAVAPDRAVTIVANHDTQALQAMEAPVETWFRPLAYALILLRDAGVPCVFYPDLYGARYKDTGGDGETHEVEMPPIDGLEKLIEARQRFAHGPQTDLFDDPHAIGFIRHGTGDAPGCVVLLTNAGDATKVFDLGPDHAGAGFRDYLGHCEEEIWSDDEGRLTARVNGGSVSVWVRSDAF